MRTYKVALTASVVVSLLFGVSCLPLETRTTDHACTTDVRFVIIGTLGAKQNRTLIQTALTRAADNIQFSQGDRAAVSVFHWQTHTTSLISYGFESDKTRFMLGMNNMVTGLDSVESNAGSPPLHTAESAAIDYTIANGLPASRKIIFVISDLRSSDKDLLLKQIIRGVQAGVVIYHIPILPDFFHQLSTLLPALVQAFV